MHCRCQVDVFDQRPKLSPANLAKHRSYNMVLSETPHCCIVAVEPSVCNIVAHASRIDRLRACLGLPTYMYPKAGLCRPVCIPS